MQRIVPTSLHSPIDGHFCHWSAIVALLLEGFFALGLFITIFHF